MSEGFVHSVKVPRLYKTVAKVVQNVQENGASLKQLIYEQKHTNVQGVYALAFNTVRHGDQLNQLIRKTQILFKEQRLDPWLTRVLITELIWGKQCLKSESKPIQTVLSYENSLREEMKNITEDVDFPKKVAKPRYVRVNTLAMSVNEAIENFQEEGWNFQSGFENYSSFLNAISNLNEETFVQDFHIPDLLVFPHGTAFFNHPGYKSGSIILQDKASCFPAFLLNPPIGSSVLDMCSAPGMKSTHLAAILQNRGKVFSIEMDERRFKTLCDFVEVTNSRCVETINKDALTVDSTQCPNIEYILVDPSCSGSGMVDREKVNGKIEKCAPGRLRSLQSFQVLLLRHALLNFPTAKKVIYSTCSIQPEENEHVIDEILSDIGEAYKLVPPKELLSENWINFSSLDFKCQDNCLYARPETDLTNGFFVAVFERNFNVPLPEYKRRSKAKKEQENKIQNQEDFTDVKQKEEEEEEKSARENEDCQENDIERTENKPENSEAKEWVMTASQKKRMRRRKKQNKLKSENLPGNDGELISTSELKSENLPGKDGELIPNSELKSKDTVSKEQLENNLVVNLETNDERTERKKKKKKNKTNRESSTIIENCPEQTISTEESSKNEKSFENSSQEQEENSLSKKKKKKEKLEISTGEIISNENSLSLENNSSQEQEENSPSKKKKKKRKLEKNCTEEIISNENFTFEKQDEGEEKSPTKKKKKSKLPKEQSPDNELLSRGEVPEEKKKKHKTNEAVDIPVNNQENENPRKKKKKERKLYEELE